MTQNWKNKIKKTGIKPYISIGDENHNFPHLHLYYSGHSAVINLNDFSIIHKDRKFPASKIKKVLSLLKSNSDLLTAIKTEFYNKNPRLK